MATRPKFGSIYRRGRIWWIKYYRPGDPKPIRESSRSDRRSDAERLLKWRQGEVVTGRFAGLALERVTVSQLLDELIEDYQVRGIRSLRHCVLRINKHLRPAFGKLKAAAFSTADVKRYIRKRRAEGAANATINRKLELLGRAFRLASEAEPPLVARVPRIEKLPENNVRTGLLRHEEYLRLRDLLPAHYRLLLVVGYHTGARLGELLSIRWSQVDFQRGEIRIEAQDSKTGRARVLPVYGEMKHWLEMAYATRDPRCPWLFQVRGRQMIFRWKTWNEYCRKAGVEGLHFHDLRRTALTNMVRAGVPEKQAMLVSGHLTRRTFERYHIVGDRDVREVAAKMERYLPGTISGTIEGWGGGNVLKDKDLLAEASGSRTHRQCGAPPTGFEDQARHRPGIASKAILTPARERTSDPLPWHGVTPVPNAESLENSSAAFGPATLSVHTKAGQLRRRVNGLRDVLNHQRPVRALCPGTELRFAPHTRFWRRSAKGPWLIGELGRSRTCKPLVKSPFSPFSVDCG